tara:strand:- start:149 stop:979 length:831 start_codon:yes stop_codon:yes gene_type:complete
MIIWLASYPKSGNTWVRLFINNLILSKNEFNINDKLIGQFPLRKHFKDISENIDNPDDFAKNCIMAQLKINLDNNVKIFKTHNAFWKWNNGEHSFTNEENTLGVIHIVRDPRNVITSVMNYFHTKNYENALEFMKKNKILGGSIDDNSLPTIIASWDNHYKSWKKFKKNYILIKYENLLNNPSEEFFKITNFLSKIANLKFDDKKISKAIKDCEFNNLTNQEEKFGFDENSKKNKKLNKKFFNLGPKNNWEEMLELNIKNEIEILFKDEMKDLGYL